MCQKRTLTSGEACAGPVSVSLLHVLSLGCERITYNLEEKR